MMSNFFIDAEAVVLEELTSDVNSITSLLKLYFRELPNPLFTSENYASFIEATSKKNNILLTFPIYLF